ncbi:MAG: aldehyde dehydrogenase family protein [Deltaproteobacteria bacterium]|nr:aldehyde dehydrogenase family protein [Deltaproteobacteria bacterium]
MEERLQFYIDGRWVDPADRRTLDVINPATEEPIAKIAMGNAEDVDRAVTAARKAFESFSQTSKQDRIALLQALLAAYQKRYDAFAETISREMGAPIWLSKIAQAATGVAHLAEMIKILESYEFEEKRGNHLIRREPVGVCGFITPWNWPLNQILCKVAPAIAAGCTMVLKPTEVAPLNAILLAEAFDEAGFPPGVFNLVNGDGPTVGQAISSHPGVDMVSFTGSTRAGILVAKAAADTVKRVTQELGGKSANVILDDADLDTAVAGGVSGCFMNSGQSCNAPTRMLVPEKLHDRAAEIAKAAAAGIKAGDPFADGTTIGPVVNDTQWNKIQRLIQLGIDQGARLVAGGPGRPEGISRGYFVRPTVFAGVKNDMTIAREEVFGPVLSILPYRDEEDAIRIANDTLYGLAGYVSGSPERAKRVASRLRAGQVQVNGAGPDFSAPFGGYKQSGNGREWGVFGFEEFLEVKAVLGAAA